MSRDAPSTVSGQRSRPQSARAGPAGSRPGDADPDRSGDPGGLVDALDRTRAGLAFGNELRRLNPRPEDLAAPLSEAVALFEELGIGYALIGGLAAMVYGAARHTVDVDFALARGPGGTVDLADHPGALAHHGFEPRATGSLYHACGVRVDLWRDAHSDGVIQRSVTHRLRGRCVRVAEPHDLVAMKLRADRPQDDYDIGELIKAGVIEVDRIRAMVGPEAVARFESIARRVMR